MVTQPELLTAGLIGGGGKMPSIPLAQADRKRPVAQEADLILRNRYLETNPALTDNAPAFIARPALRFWKHIGEPGDPTKGPIRKVFSQPGAFDDDMFVVPFNSLYRISRADGLFSLIDNTLNGGETNDAVRMACTGDIGTIGPRLWIADGATLRVYMEDGFATGNLEATANFADGDVVRLGSMYYRMSTGSLDSGSPAGTVGNPWRVLIGAFTIQSITNLYHAINNTGVNGTDYSTALTENTEAVAMTATIVGGLAVRASAEGTAGNTVVTTETGANCSWTNGATLANGGSPGIITVPIPGDIGVLDVAVINNFVIVIPAQGEGVNGRFYWVNPGETSIDPLDFATAERSPDPVHQVVVFSDQFWLPGQDTTEVYYMSGNPDAPVTRFQGVVFDRGVHPGCSLRVFGSMVNITPFGEVYQIKGGEKKISTPDIDERLRRAIAYQNIYGSL